jgi:hypothetical protein
VIIDIRHHLFSLVSVFLALGLGILIGTSISSDGRIVKEQSALIDAIESQLSQLRRERQAVEANLTQTENHLARYREFAQEVLPRLVSGQLEGRQVGLVVLGDSQPDTQEALRELMRLSGAQVNGSVMLRGEALAISGKIQAQLVQALAAVFFENDEVAEAPDLVWQQRPAAKADSIVVVDGTGSSRTRQLASALSGHRPSAQVVVSPGVESPIEQWALIKRLAGGGQ